MLALWRRNQLGPRYERQLIFMAEPTPHLKHPPRTPSRHSSFFAPDGRAETDSFHFETRGHCCAPIYMQFVAEGVVYVVCPRTTTSFCHKRELPPARLEIHRQTSAHTQRDETLGGAFVIGHNSAFLHPTTIGCG